MPVETPQSAPEQADGISEYKAKANIYSHESSNSLAAINSGGCKGLGQDCNGQLEINCPDWQTNYGCQDAYFTRYMQNRYGSWLAAWQHWLARIPINGQDVGNWW